MANIATSHTTNINNLKVSHADEQLRIYASERFALEEGEEEGGGGGREEGDEEEEGEGEVEERSHKFHRHCCRQTIESAI